MHYNGGMAAFRERISELRRRRVFRAAGIYVVGAWVAVQVASLVFPALDIPENAIRHVWVGVLLLFPLYLVFAWFFDLTAGGLQRTLPAGDGRRADPALRRADYAILAALAVVTAAIGWQLAGNIRSAGAGGTDAVRDEVEPNSIAVLPLENLSGDPEQQYFVAGMQDALIASLSRVRGLKVTSKTSTLRYAGAAMPVATIGAELGVAKLIEGAVYRSGDEVRISITLVDAQHDAHIFADTFEGRLHDVLDLQRDVAGAIAQNVEGVVADSAPGRRVDPAAYEAFLKGQFHLERFTPQDMALAMQYFRQAATLDPDSALAQYGLSRLCAFQAQIAMITPAEARENCLPPISRALALDPGLAEAHLMYAAHMTWQRFDWDEAGKGFRRAIELNPSYAEARMFYSHFLAITGQLEESTRQANVARDLDPFNPFSQGLYGGQRWLVGDADAAISVVEATIASTPGFGFGYDILLQAYHEQGDYANASRALLGLLKTSGEDHPGVAAYRDTVPARGYLDSLVPIADALAAGQAERPVMPTTIGMLYEYGGEIDTAIDWYETALEAGSPDAPYLGPAMGSQAVHARPRFIELLRRLRLDYWADRYEQERLR